MTCFLVCVVEEVSTDEPDYLSPDSAQRDRLRHQVEGLRRDITRIITFSNDDLQVCPLVIFLNANVQN